MKVPWARPYFDSAEVDSVNKTLTTGWLSQGENVKALEARICELTGSTFAVAVNSGTAALDVALKLLNIKPGDKVLVPAFTYIASVNCILYQGAKPVFVDIDPCTFNLSVDSAQRRVTSSCKAVIVIDYAGQSAAWNELRSFADEFGLSLVEDAAPAMGGKYNRKSLGTMGDIGITSFHIAKNFTSVEGGMLFLHDKELDSRARIIRSQGESPEVKYRHVELGHNYRMTDLHAAVGLAQFSRYHAVLEDRTRAADYYSEHLTNINGITVPLVLPGNTHGWFLYPILINKRNQIREHLTEMGVETNVSWPYPAYEQPYLKQYFSEPCPVTEQVCSEVLCLPLYYGITQEEQDYVISSIERSIGEVDK